MRSLSIPLRLFKLYKKLPRKVHLHLVVWKLVLLSISLFLYRASTFPSITESSGYKCEHSRSMFHCVSSKHDVIASKIVFLFRSITIIKSSALYATSWTGWTMIKWQAFTLWQACNHKTTCLYKYLRKIRIITKVQVRFELRNLNCEIKQNESAHHQHCN